MYLYVKLQLRKHLKCFHAEQEEDTERENLDLFSKEIIVCNFQFENRVWIIYNK